MNEDRERDLQDWFNRSVQELPRQPFALLVAEKVKRKERIRQLLRYAVVLFVCFAVCLLLPELIAALDKLAALPATVMAAKGEHWPLLVLLVAGPTCWLVNRARSGGFFRGG